MLSKNLYQGNELESNKESLTAKASVIESSALFEDILKSGLSLRVKVTGRSMSPFLAGGEILTIQMVPPSSLRRGDLIFFRTQEGFPLLHRIFRKKMKGNMLVFQTKGDALFSMDAPVSERDILGKVSRIEKTVSDGVTRYMDMESFVWKTANYLHAVISVGKLHMYNTVFSRSLYKSFRSLIKKTFI